MDLVNSIKKLPLSRDFVLELLFLAILVTPFQSFVDVMWMFTSHTDLGEWYNINTPVALKAMKDVIVVLLFPAFLFRLKELTPTSKKILGLILFILVFSAVSAYLKKIPLPIIVAGIRWYLPLLFFPLFDNFRMSRETFLSFYKRFQIIVYAALILQVLQILFSWRWGICTRFQIGCRSSGFFAMPQPMAMLSLLFLTLAMELPERLQKKKDLIVSSLSVFLTKSGAGFIGLGAFLFLKVQKKFKIAVLVILAIAIFLFPIVSGRSDFWESPLTRLEIVRKINYSQTIFGTYTNACNNFQKVNNFSNICATPDSFLSTLLGNLGIIFTLLTLGYISFYIYKSKRYCHFAMLFIMLVGGSYTEYFPMNILFPLLIGLRVDNLYENEVENNLAAVKS